MSKKESLANSMRRRPNLKRTVVGNEESAKKVVDKVADANTNPPKSTAKPAKKAAPTAPKPAEPLKRLTIDIPASLHMKLKLSTIQSGETMRDHVVKLIEKSLK